MCLPSFLFLGPRGRLEGPASALPTNSPLANWLGLRLRPLPGADEGSRLAAAATRKIRANNGLRWIFRLLQRGIAQTFLSHNCVSQAQTTPSRLTPTIEKKVDLVSTFFFIFWATGATRRPGLLFVLNQFGTKYRARPLPFGAIRSLLFVGIGFKSA